MEWYKKNRKYLFAVVICWLIYRLITTAMY